MPENGFELANHQIWSWFGGAVFKGENFDHIKQILQNDLKNAFLNLISLRKVQNLWNDHDLQTL